MKTPMFPASPRLTRPSLRRAALIAGVLSLSLNLAQAQTTGFNQTGAGPYDYNNTSDWVGGTINGIWDSSLTITAAQTATFGADTTLGTGLSFLYTGNFDLTLRSDGTADRTLTLGGDVLNNMVNNRVVTFGSTTANQGLNVNLGGDRTFTMNANKTVRFFNLISGGNITLTGTNPASSGGIFRMSGTSSAASSAFVVSNNTTLQYDNTAGGAGATRSQSVTLNTGGKILASGNNASNSVDAITGNVVIDGSGPRPRSANSAYSSITVSPGTKNALVTLNNFQRASRGTVLIRGTNLGANSIGSATGGSGNLQVFGTAPTLIGGGGAAGSTNISILPWAIGGTSAADNGTTFVTYTTANGFRPLDINTEFATSFGNATDNVNLGVATTLNSNATVNSLLLSAAGATLSGAGTLTVTSGAILMTRSTGASSGISANLDFGTAEGIIQYARGDTISGAIAGSGGLTVNGNRNDEAMTFTNGASTYTGDTYILSAAQVSAGFLPSSSRTGDVYVYGNLQLSTAGFTGTINGLWGSGVVTYGNSVVSSLSLGDNNATSTFTGTIAGNSNLSVSKIGNGTLTLTGEQTWGRATSILGGTLDVSVLANGGVASGLGQSASTATNLVISSGTLKYNGAAVGTDRLFQVGQTTAGGVATLDASGSGAVNFTNTGSIVYGTTNQTRSLVLTGTNTGANTLSATIANNGTGLVSVTKNGSGKWILAGNNTFTGTAIVNAGSLLLNGSNASAATVNGGVLGGTGSVGAVTVGNAGAITGGDNNTAGLLNTGNLSFTGQNSTLSLQISGTGAGAYDQINVAGAVDLSGNGKIQLSLVGYTPVANDLFFVILNDGADAITGTLFGLAQGATFSAGGYSWKVSYTGDSIGHNFTGGNDLALQLVPEPQAWMLFAAGAAFLLVFRRSRPSIRQS